MRRVRCAHTAGLAAGLTLVASVSWARDLPRSDPDRAALLDASREEPDAKFIVRDFFKAGDYAFLCALVKDPLGGVEGTDGEPDVHQNLLVREGGRWISVADVGALARNERDVSCQVELHDDRSNVPGDTRRFVVEREADLIRIIVSELQSTIRHDLDLGTVRRETLDHWELLERKKIARDFSVEYAKPVTEPLPGQVTNQLPACGSAACKNALVDAYHALIALRKDDRVSSLVW